MRNFFILATALFGCSGDSSSSVSVGNSNPLGTVGGVVIDAATEMPMMGAMVQIIAGGKVFTGTTDASGVFAVGSVPSGSFIANVSNTGFVTASLNDQLVGSVGNFPVKDPIATLGPIGLVKNDGTFAVKIVDEMGAPVASVTVTARPQIRWINFANGSPNPVGSYEVTAMSGADGITSFMGLPNYTSLGSIGGGGFDNLPIDVPPVQVMGSMTVYSFLGGTFSFQVNHLANNGVIDTPIIRLAGPTTPLQIINSNLDILRGMQAGSSGAPVNPNFSFVSVVPYVSTTGNITLEFNQVINKSTLRAQLYNEDGTVSQIAMMAAATNNVLSLTPSAALTAGTRYNLSLHVDADAVTGQSAIARELNTTVPLFVAPATGATLKVLTTSIKSLPGPSPQPFVFQFSEPVGIGFGNTGVSCVVFYDNATVNLDGDSSSLYPGEYDKTKVTQLNCPTPRFDITSMVPLETGGFPITGFASKWQITYDDLGAGNLECKPGQEATCAFPATGSQIYLKPSRASNGNGTPTPFKRPDGTPVPDNDTNLSFPIPPP